VWLHHYVEVVESKGAYFVNFAHQNKNISTRLFIIIPAAGPKYSGFRHLSLMNNRGTTKTHPPSFIKKVFVGVVPYQDVSIIKPSRLIHAEGPECKIL
jgi:hypothetical protein